MSRIGEVSLERRGLFLGVGLGSPEAGRQRLRVRPGGLALDSREETG